MIEKVLEAYHCDSEGAIPQNNTPFRVLGIFHRHSIVVSANMVRPTGPRDPIAGPDTPQPPFPLKLRGPVIKGFGRGSKEARTHQAL